jgi:hypothetical protein
VPNDGIASAMGGFHGVGPALERKGEDRRRRGLRRLRPSIRPRSARRWARSASASRAVASGRSTSR